MNTAFKVLKRWQTVDNYRMVIDFSKSKGNFLKDANGKRYLDLLTQIASLPLGYNHPRLLKTSLKNHSYLSHRFANGMFPDKEHIRLLDTTLQRCYPQFMDQKKGYIHTDVSGALANEAAIKAAFLWKMKQLKDPKPDANKLKMISFENSFHGRTLGTLSATHAQPQYRKDLPLLEWDTIPFPKMMNPGDELRCLKKLEKLCKDNYPYHAGMIIEPILSEGGDLHASDKFFKTVRSITKSWDVPLIVDEVQTGLGSTGKMWGHEHWNVAPDIVTFSKKCQIAGFFAHDKFRPEYTFQIFNTWMGDTGRGIILEEILNVIEEEHLIKRVHTLGKYIKKCLQSKNLSNVRGRGTVISFDMENTKTRDDLIDYLEEKGVIVGRCGNRSIRLRPSLTITKEEIDIFLDIL